MQEFNLNYAEGDKIYLVPLGVCFGGLSGLRLGGSALRFTAVQVVIRRDGIRIFDQTLSYNQMDAFRDSVEGEIAAALDTALERLSRPRPPLTLPNRETPLAFTRPLVMGVLNVTPDSFSDGGDFVDVDKAVQHARAMRAAGADIIDIGGESTRPGAKPLWEGDEAERILPVITALKDDDIPISIDSRHSTVMEIALNAGAAIINDVSALSYDGLSMSVATKSNAPVILMHAKGTPQNMQDNPSYSDVLFDIYDYLGARIQVCEEAGIDRSRLIVDPGIGFGKGVLQDNLTLINGIALLHTLGVPVMFGASRKRFIGAITGAENAKDRMPGSLTAAINAVSHGVQIVRVHDVAETVQAVRLQQALIDAGAMAALPPA